MLFDLSKGSITYQDCMEMEVEDFKGWLDDGVKFRTDMNKAIAAANAEAEDD